jgi:uncharacterized membrane protein
MNNPMLLTEEGERHISPLASLAWLGAGWRDFWRNPVPGLLHGLALVVFGVALLLIAHDRFWLLAGAYSGFLIVGPIVVTGLYEISRGLARGQRLSVRDALKVWSGFDRRLVKFGLLLGFAGSGWVLTSAGFITLFADHPVTKPLDFLRHVVLAPQAWLFGTWLLLGGLLAAPMFASSVVAIPMIMDQPVSVRHAIAQSWAVCASHPEAMAVWALLLMILVGVGMLTAMVGLVVIVPWLAHASWHAYTDLVPVNPKRAGNSPRAQA